MATSARVEFYKHKAKDITEIKLATQSSVKNDQTRHRDRLILNKRLKIESLEEAETVLTAQEELEKVTLARQLLKHGKKVEALTILRKCFARDAESTKNFLRNEGLQVLQSCLLSTDSEVLHSAAWCVINLTAGTSLSANRIQHLSHLLIQFLQGSDPLMQELCAWAIGNVAGDCHKHREILLQQGCLPPLVALVSSQYHLTVEARSQSVLFALINLARDENYAFIRCQSAPARKRQLSFGVHSGGPESVTVMALTQPHTCMLENSLCDHLELMLRTTDAACDLCFEIGWLANYVYGRQDTYLEHEDQYSLIVNSLIVKLSQVICLVDKVQQDKVILPYLRSLGNAIGQHPNVALIASDSASFLPTLFTCLTSSTEFIQKEALWILANFMAEPSCRVLVMGQSRFVNVIFDLCNKADVETALNALYLLEASSKVSTWMCQYLVELGTLGVLLKLLGHPKLQIIEASLDILHDLVTVTVKGKTALLNTEILHLLQAAALNEDSIRVMEKAKYLISLL